MSGIVNGFACAVVTGIAVYFWSHSAGLSFIIGAAMVISMSIAGMSGAAVPLILKALEKAEGNVSRAARLIIERRDPAAIETLRASLSELHEAVQGWRLYPVVEAIKQAWGPQDDDDSVSAIFGDMNALF